MNKRFVVIMVAAIAVFGGLIFVSKSNKSTDQSQSSDQTTNHTFGQSPTGVTLTEYGDFQCPACYSYFPLVSQIKEEYKDRVVFQFRHFPIVQRHQNAMAAHRAAEAAGLQDKFWEMHDLLFQNQKSWEASTNPAKVFEGYATQLDLNMDKYTSAVSSSAVNDAIGADLKSGQSMAINSTPTFLVNGEVIELPNSLEEFKKVIDEAIKEKAAQ